MTREVALGMLRVGNTGNDILQILDVIAADIESEKTINEIAEILFWVILMRGTVDVNQSASVVDTLPPYMLYCDYQWNRSDSVLRGDGRAGGVI